MLDKYITYIIKIKKKEIKLLISLKGFKQNVHILHIRKYSLSIQEPFGKCIFCLLGNFCSRLFSVVIVVCLLRFYRLCVHVTTKACWYFTIFY